MCHSSGKLSDTFVTSTLIFLQVLSGKQPWSEVREDLAVVLRLAKGHKPGRPESRAMDDSHWNLIQHCLSDIEERPAAEVITSTIQRFLNCCRQSPPLREYDRKTSLHVTHVSYLTSS